MYNKIDKVNEKILSILNPVHEPTIGEWKSIADKICLERDEETGIYEIPNEFFKLLQRWQELTRGKNEVKYNDIGQNPPKSYYSWQPALLKKQMFVCEVEKPYPAKFEVYKERYNEFAALDEDAYNSATKAYTQAQEQVLFDGFVIEKYGVYPKNRPNDVGFKVYWGNENVNIYNGCLNAHPHKPTISDLITEISRYNRTASKKIELNWTPNILRELGLNVLQTEGV